MPQYSKTTWVDGTAPAISAANLNKLEQGVFDSIRQDGSTTMSAQFVTIAGTAATPAIAPTGDANTGIFFPAADTIAFGEGGAEAMRITSAGNVGIGTPSPSVKLNLYDANTAIQINEVATGGTGVAALRLKHGANYYGWYVDSANGLVTYDYQAGAERMRITSAGYLLIGYTSSNGAYPLQINGQIFATSSTIATSDGKYKKDIVALDGALDIVTKLNPLQFSWKEHPVHKFNTEVPTVGFIAQEVAEVLKDKAYLTSLIKKSECTWETETGETVEREVTKEVTREVTEEVDGEEVTRTITEEVTEIVTEPVKETHTEEFLGIAESNMIAILTKAIQELNAKVEALEAQLAK